MNYRHIYHAGNICDVVKHVTLLALLSELQRKPAPFVVLDTHAGSGLYDLAAPEAQKTSEAAQGVLRLLDAGQRETLAHYWAALAAFNPALQDQAGFYQPDQLKHYPGSPVLIAAALRPQDRLIGCELHPLDYAALRAALPRQPQIQLHHRDGYEALLAFTPPPEKRGLVLIDPPFERADEFERLTAAIVAAHRHWPQGIYAIWYPLKDLPALWRWQEAMIATGIRKQMLLEFAYAAPPDGLHGSGMLVINPPWQLAQTIDKAYAAIHHALARPVQETKIDWLVPE